ncbi:hypothetical protein QJS66_05290 [Kocuria rhizophila]|nr:hypothetical protein QJS66_05290 [Kocuria rhizophila]
MVLTICHRVTCGSPRRTRSYTTAREISSMPVQNPEGLPRGARPVASRCTPPPWRASSGEHPRRSRRSCATRSVQPRIRRPPSWKRGGPCWLGGRYLRRWTAVPTGGELGTLKKVGAMVADPVRGECASALEGPEAVARTAAATPVPRLPGARG